MSSETQEAVKGEAAMTPSVSSEAPPLSPSATKPPELPDELVQAGWAKCWSRRENRPYWFNRFTNQSLWEVPVLGQHDVISDPLGLNAAPADGPDGNLGNGQRKRRSSEEQGAGPNSLKRPRVEPTTPISPCTPGLKPWSSERDDKLTQPPLTQPGITQPPLTQPGITQPPLTQPGITQPPLTQPGQTQPGQTQPGQTQPGQAQPVAGQPGQTQPGQTQPAAAVNQSGSGPAPGPAPAPYRPAVVYWDLDIQTNAVIRERPPTADLPPHPEIELQRATLVTKLRGHYQELCHQREGIEPPRESFNRWLLERKTIDRGHDPLLPSDCEPVISPSMFREVMNDIPIRLARIKYKEEARKLLFKYAEAAKKMIDSRNASPESRKVVKWNAEDTMSWLRRDHSASKEDYMDRLDHLRRQCGPHVTAVAKDSVEGICSKIYQLSVDYSRRLRQTHLTLLNTQPPADPVAPPSSRLVYCYPVRLALASPALPRVELHFENDVACLRYKGEMVKVNRGHFSKLELLYRYSCIDDPRFEKFLSRVWTLMKRYQVLFGGGVNEGSGLQGALPVPVFEALHRQFGVSFECFASPLNCFFKQFGSAFPDIDGFFGSRGPFLSFSPVSGSFEANPPFCEELMDAMVTHFEGLLAASLEPLSFIVFVPEWRDPVTPALTRMESSSFLRHQLNVPPYEHEYRSGSQHVCKREEMSYRAVHGTAVLFLQNEAGFAKWGPTAERLAELTAAYRPSMTSPGPAPLASDRPTAAVTSPGSHDNNNNNSSSSSSPVDKTAAV